jgi:hypothetical protein
MTNAPVGTKIHQALDIHGDRTTQIAFDHKFSDFGTELLDLGIGQILDLDVACHACGVADTLRSGTANAINGGQCDLHMLVNRYIYACYTCHLNLSPGVSSRAKTRKDTDQTPKNQPNTLALTLFMRRVRTNHPHYALAAHNTAIPTHLLY